MLVNDNLIKLKNHTVKFLEKLIIYCKKNIKVIISTVLIVSLGFGYGIGYIRSTKEYFFNNLTKAVNKEDTKKLAKLMSYEGDKSDVIPFVEYLKLDNNKNSFLQSIKDSGTYNNLTLTQDKGLLFKKYKIEVKPVEIHITVNYPAEIYINDLDSGKADENSQLNITKDIPGLYTIEGKTINEYGEVTADKEVSVFKDTDVSLNLEGNSLTINSPYSDGKVYINGEDINIKVSDVKEFSFFSSDEKNKLYFEYDFPWGTIKSEEISIGKYPEISPKINIVNDKLKEDVNGVIKSFYDSVINSLNKEDIQLIKEVPENLRFSIYSDLTKKYFLLKNTYTLRDLEVNMEEESFKQVEGNKYTGKALVKLSYSTSKNIAGISFGENYEEKSFITTCEYIDGKWNIISISKN